jgi:transcriptional regulator with XRE-family HTH domain
VRSPGRQQREPETPYRVAVGLRVRELRKAADDISQIDLANQVNMSARYLGGIERGTANVSLDILVRLANALGVEPADLLPPVQGR